MSLSEKTGKCLEPTSAGQKRPRAAQSGPEEAKGDQKRTTTGPEHQTRAGAAPNTLSCQDYDPASCVGVLHAFYSVVAPSSISDDSGQSQGQRANHSPDVKELPRGGPEQPRTGLDRQRQPREGPERPNTGPES